MENSREIIATMVVILFWALLVQCGEQMVTKRWEEHQEELNMGVSK